MGLDMNLKPLSMTKLNTKVNKITGTAALGLSTFLPAFSGASVAVSVCAIVACLDRREWKRELHHGGKRFFPFAGGGSFARHDIVADGENPQRFDACFCGGGI